MGRLRGSILPLLDVPLMRRVAWHANRIRGGLDRRFVLSLTAGIVGLVAIAAVLITLLEKPWTLQSFGSSFYWGLTTIFGQGDSTFVTSPGGWLVSWVLILLGVAMLGTITGALVAAVIDFLLKEGQGMGAAGYRDHIVVCGWNATARDLIQELRGDEYRKRLVIVHDADRNPAGEHTYYVKGDPTEVSDLRRAAVAEAAVVVVVPTDDSNDADMRDILVVMAVKAEAPDLRVVVEVNNARHVEHFQRARADEVLVTSTLASHLLARSALYPGLAEVVTDIVSGGAGSELYRIALPEAYVGLSANDLSARLRTEHRATLLSIGRDGELVTNPPAEYIVHTGDDALVVAESLGELAPLAMERAISPAHGRATVPAGSTARA